MRRLEPTPRRSEHLIINRSLLYLLIFMILFLSGLVLLQTVSFYAYIGGL